MLRFWGGNDAMLQTVEPWWSICNRAGRHGQQQAGFPSSSEVGSCSLLGARTSLCTPYFVETTESNHSITIGSGVIGCWDLAQSKLVVEPSASACTHQLWTKPWRIVSLEAPRSGRLRLLARR
ncbi:hypothetical protein BJX66DRAFT_41814 [Aspergillus keveii]|uniref:Uncharacterized protein n=1 Tax=Aspergillus keveii TaxID=714993 RepID=A0ABR4FS11_9EURO